MSDKLVQLHPYRRTEGDLPVPQIYPTCENCKYVRYPHYSFILWTCAARGYQLIEGLEGRGQDCERWTPEPPPPRRRSLLRWLWDVLFAWS